MSGLTKTLDLGRRRRWAIAAVVLGLAWAPRIAGQGGDSALPGQGDDPEISIILDRAIERARKYAIELQSLAWTDVVRYEALDEDGRRLEEDKPRELTYETILRLEPWGDPADPSFFVREEAELKLVDGEPVDPDYELPWTTSLEFSADLGFFYFLFATPEFQHDWSMSYAGRDDLGGRDSIVVDMLIPRGERPPRIVRIGDLVSVAGVPFKHRIWLDTETYDVLQIEWQRGPVEFVQSRNDNDRWRHERRGSMRYKTIAFEDPEQVFLVPESQEMAILIEGESPAVRRWVHSFTNYRRFTGEVRRTPLED